MYKYVCQNNHYRSGIYTLGVADEYKVGHKPDTGLHAISFLNIDTMLEKSGATSEDDSILVVSTV